MNNGRVLCFAKDNVAIEVETHHLQEMLMDCYYAGIGFGARGVEGAEYILRILGLSIAESERIPIANPGISGFGVAFSGDEASSAILRSYSSEDMATAQESSLYLLMLVDESDPAAVEAAIEAGSRAKEAGVYLSIAVCMGGIEPGADGGFMRRPELRKLRQAVDNLVFVKHPSQSEYDDAPGARVALALMTAILPQRINLICTDIADIKQVLRDYVVANVARTNHTNLSHEAAGQGIISQMDVTSASFANPQGVFCSYSASPEAANLDDFSMVGSFVHDAMEAAYPSADYDLVAACLMDKSLEGSVEVITCVSFQDEAD